MGAKAYGRIVFWEGGSLWVFRAAPGETYPKTDAHSHHAIQVTLALTGRVVIEAEAGRITHDAIAIAPSSLHAFEGSGLVAHLFVAPDSKAGRQIARLFATGPVTALAADRLADVPDALRATFEDPRHSDADLRVLGRRLVAQLAGEVPPADLPDPRILKLIAWVAPRLEGAISLSDAAAVVKLSPGRARHLFVEQTGLPFRTNLLWLRLTRAVEIYAGRASLTEAAHGAGFADSAHLSRTFRRMFGVAAASLRVS